MHRLLAVAAVAVVAGIAGPALANPVPPNPVHVWRGTDGSVCFAISEQVPHCTPPVVIIQPPR